MKTIFIFFTLMTLYSTSIFSKEAFIGKFKTISESSWKITLELKENHDVEIVYTAWIAGEYKSRDIKEYTGKWELEDDNIKLTFNDEVSHFKYTENLNFSSKVSGPGLSFIKTKDKDDLLHRVQFWKKPVTMFKK